MLTFFCKKFEMQQNRRETEIAAKKFEMACIANENARLAVCFYPVVLFAYISFTGVCMSECVYLRTVGLCRLFSHVLMFCYSHAGANTEHFASQNYTGAD
jgi:hypothetical protein